MFNCRGKDIGLSESQVSRICKEATMKLKTALKNPSEDEDEPTIS